MPTPAIDHEAVLKRLKYIVREAVPEAQQAHLCEALAAGLGYATHAALLASFRSGAIDPDLHFSGSDFEDRLLDLGYELDGYQPHTIGKLINEAIRTIVPETPIGSNATDPIRTLFAHQNSRMAKETERKLADLAARGLEAAQRGDIFSPYGEALSYGMRWVAADRGDIEIRIWLRNYDASRRERRAVGGMRPVWGQSWPDHPATVSGEALLAFLAAKWPILASDWLKQRTELSSEVDFRQGIGRPDLPRFTIAVHGPELEAKAERGRCRPGSESIMIIESLLTLGEEIASGLAERGLAPDVVAAWRAARALDDLPPTEAERGAWEGPSDACVEAGALYYAAKLGLSPEQYRAAAIFEKAAHDAWHEAGCHGVEPQGGDGFRAAKLGVLPPSDELMRMAEVSRMMETGDEKSSVEAWMSESLSQASTENRATLFYRGWPRRLPPFSGTPVPAGSDGSHLVGMRLRLGAGYTAEVVGLAEPSVIGEPMVTIRYDRRAGEGGDGKAFERPWPVSGIIELMAETE